MQNYMVSRARLNVEKDISDYPGATQEGTGMAGFFRQVSKNELTMLTLQVDFVIE